MRTNSIKTLVEEAKSLADEKSLSVKARKKALSIVDWFESAYQTEVGEPDKQGFRDYVRDRFVETLQEAGITSGRICEIGGPYNSFASELKEYDFEFLSLYPDKKHKNIIVADAGRCNYVEDDTFDAVFSVSVFEHISKPWNAASEMTRIVKPGGINFHAAPFSYFYHGAPADFWRYTPDAFKLLFSQLKPVKAEFYGKNRRRDNRGSEVNAVDRDGGPAFAVDEFGGWRENWFTLYAGQKDSDFLADRIAHNEKQVVINLMKHFEQAKLEPEVAARKVQSIMSKTRVDHDEEFTHVGRGEGVKFTRKEILELWNRRGRNGIRPSYSRFVNAALLGL